jgi:hypothetical protein
MKNGDRTELTAHVSEHLSHGVRVAQIAWEGVRVDSRVVQRTSGGRQARRVARDERDPMPGQAELARYRVGDSGSMSTDDERFGHEPWLARSS